LLLDASFCRSLVVFVVGGIEAMLESWRGRNRFNVLEKYFAESLLIGLRRTLRNAPAPKMPPVNFSGSVNAQR
jgi:hypothetical protein